jgi:hypothetical protein
MKYIKPIAVCLFIAFFFFICLEAKQDVKPRYTRMPDFKKTGSFAELKKRAESMDSTLDFYNLRMSYTRTSLYHPDDSLLIPLKRRMLSLFDVHKFKEAALVGDSILRKDYCDLFTHLGMVKIFNRLKETKKAQKHDFIFNGLIKSIINSGDGNSPETAWMVISVQEEYFIVKYYGFGYLSQTPMKSSRGPVNIMSGARADSTNVFYFNVSLLPGKGKKQK